MNLTKGDDMRMTKISCDNLKVAEEARIQEMKSGGFGVQVFRNGNSAFLSSADGVLIYDSMNKAERAIRRIRPELRITTI